MSALGDKFREAAGYAAADGRFVWEALRDAGMRENTAIMYASTLMCGEDYCVDDNHRFLLLLLAAAMADTGDLK